MLCMRQAILFSAIVWVADGLALQHADRNSMKGQERPLRDIYVLAGQSNCVGMARQTDLPSKLAQAPEHVFAWPTVGGTEWKPYSVEDDLDNGFNYPARFGLEVSLIHKLAQHYEKAGESFGVIKVAKVGASLQEKWSCKGWQHYAKNASAMQELRDTLAHNFLVPGSFDFRLFEYRLDKIANGTQEPPPLLFSVLLDTVKSAMSSPQCAGGRCRVRALIWVQGEADAKYAESASAYNQNLHDLFDIVRKEWASQDMFVGISELAPFCFTNVMLPAAEQVLSAQESFVREEGPSSAGMISAKGLTDRGDGIHYDANSYVQLGDRAAQLLGDRLKLDI